MINFNILPLHNILIGITLLIFATLPTNTQATCNIAYDAKCDAINYTATSNIFFYVNETESNKDYDTYNATITYHWGPENITVGPQAYNITQPYGLSSTYQYTNEGYYLTGYTVEFLDNTAAGCSRRTFERLSVLHMERTPNSCELNAETPKPTMSPTVSARPTMSASPTSIPTSGSAIGMTMMNGNIRVLVLGLVAAVASLVV